MTPEISTTDQARQRLKDLRASGMKVRDIAWAIGCDQSIVSQWLHNHGMSPMSAERILRKTRLPRAVATVTPTAPPEGDVKNP